MADDKPPHARPLTRAQAVQNAAFLRHLRRTGNVRLSAREAGVKYATIQHRRSRHPAFAQRWDAAIAVAQARLRAGGGAALAKRTAPGDPHRTEGGEPVVMRVRAGRLQVRRAHPGKLTKACEQAFLAALSATANVALSAAAAGASEAAFHRRRRRNPGFAREMRLALEIGYRRLEMALLAGFAPESHDDDGWRHNEPPPIPAMTANQALQLMYLHQKEAVLGGTPEVLRLRPGETSQMQGMRLVLLAEHRDELAREKFRVAEAAREARGEPRWLPPDPNAPVLPALDQVTGGARRRASRHGTTRGHCSAGGVLGDWLRSKWQGLVVCGPAASAAESRQRRLWGWVMRKTVMVLWALSFPAALVAQGSPTAASLTGVSFLVGDWQTGRGQVADTGGTANGRSVMSLEAGGNVLLRKDHTDLFDKTGKPTASFEQVMMVYPEAGTLHADYSDGQHVIHYTTASVVAGKSVTFTSAAQPNAPTFRLQYSLDAPRTLSVRFEIAPPGSADFHPIATGTLSKAS